MPSVAQGERRTCWHFPSSKLFLSTEQRLIVASWKLMRRIHTQREQFVSRLTSLVLFAFSLLAISPITSAQPKPEPLSLTQQQASHFADLALKCIQKEYPNKPDHVINDTADLRSPRAMHGTFYGCFDWHSSVHGHWMLAHLLRLFPAMPEAGKIRSALNANLDAKNIAGEVAYLKEANRASFE